jgi:glycosyltransferase involved in cell wall biosynthesis
MTADLFVSVVAPVHEPGALLSPFVDEVVTVLAGAFRHYELILVDDGSRDVSRAEWDALLARVDGVRVLHLSREFGEEQAIAAGLDTAIGDFVVTMSPGADPPALIPQLVQRSRDGADVVLGVRASRAGDPWWLRAGAGLFYWYARRMMRLDLPANATHFRCLSRQALNALNKLRETGSRLRVFSSYIGYASAAFPYTPIGQTRRSRSRTPGEAVGVALAMVLDNTAHPLRLASLLGVMAAVLNLAYAAYVLIVYTLRDDVAPGWATMSLTSAAQFFFLSLILAVLCEYVGRLPKQFGTAPGYYVREERSSAVLLREDRPNVVRES